MTVLRQLLGVDLPVIQAPMAGVQDSALALAVSNAGGLGSLPCALLDPAGLQREFAALKAGTQRPFNVNFFCHAPPEPDAEREALWRRTLAPYHAEAGIDAERIAPGPGRAPFDAQAAARLAELRSAVVSFVFGLPSEALLQAARASGARVLGTATTLDEARWLEARGVDGIVAQGWEAGGHRGMFLGDGRDFNDALTRQVGTLALVSQVVRAVRVPVIAAGGIADARGVAAVLALGAVAAQVGSAYLLCPEATTSAVHRAALQSDAAAHTAVTTLLTGRPARGIVNRLMRELGPTAPVTPAFPLAGAALAPLRAWAEAQGRGDFSPLWAGQNAAGAKAVAAAELTQALAAG